MSRNNFQHINLGNGIRIYLGHGPDPEERVQDDEDQSILRNMDDIEKQISHIYSCIDT